MQNHIVRTTLALASCVLLGASVASAQATQTWVSGVGDDVDPCSRTAPCKTFAGAISKTAAGGQISVLDPGGFGAVTITKSITISGVGEQGSILASSTNGIVINAGPSDVITLKNLQINGAPDTGIVGIRFLAGSALIIDTVHVFGFDQGLQTSGGNTMVRNSLFTNNRTYGINSLGGTVSLEGSVIVSNGTGVMANGGTVRLSNNKVYNNGNGFVCGAGVIASAGNNRKGGNTGGGGTPCTPSVAITLQ
jgi:hypothetical protein